MILNPYAARAARGHAVPLTIVRDTKTSLSRRRSVSVDEAPRLLRNHVTRDTSGLMTFDAQTADAAGVFLVGELERLDQRLHMPLASVTWSRDIDLREDVSIADEKSSFTNSSFAQAQGIAGSNKAWINKESSAIVGVSLDIGKTTQDLNLWAVQLSWTIPELMSAQQLGRPVDDQKYMGMQLKYQMDVDEQVYMGDTALNMNGMFNHSALTNTGNAANGSWSSASAANILADINSILSSVWTTSAYAVMPDKLLIAPPEYTVLVSTLISSAGNISILKFVEMNNLAAANGGKLEIQPAKWLLGTNNSGKGPTATDSMFAYVKDPMRIRFPLTPLQRTPVEYRDIRQLTTYFGRVGAVEMVYPETCARRSNLG